MPTLASSNAALGFSLHTGWAAAVAVTGGGEGIDVVLRRRLELLPSAASLPRFVYHRAAELDLAEAEELIQSALAAARASARKAIEEALHATSAGGWKIRAAGIPTGSTAIPNELPRILAAHTLIHAAEGRLFQNALAAACETYGLRHFAVRQRDLWTKAAEATGMDEKRLRANIDGLRKAAGPPWSADQKIATAAALFALGAGGR
jgi:hypothetical protein